MAEEPIYEKNSFKGEHFTEVKKLSKDHSVPNVDTHSVLKEDGRFLSLFQNTPPNDTESAPHIMDLNFMDEEELELKEPDPVTSITQDRHNQIMPSLKAVQDAEEEKTNLASPTTDDNSSDWKMVTIGERSVQEYEIINGVLGKEELIQRHLSNENNTTKLQIKNIQFEMLNIHEDNNFPEYFSTEKNWKADTILYFLPRHDYQQAIRIAARKCDQKFWKICVILVDCTQNSESAQEKISTIKETISEILSSAGIPRDIIGRLQILPIGHSTSLHLPRYQFWFARICWTVLGVSSTSSQKHIIKVFAQRMDPKYNGQTNELYLRSIKIPPEIKMSKKEKIALAVGSSGAAVAAGGIGATIGALIGALAIGIPSFGVAAGAGLVIGAAIGGGVGVGVGGAVAGGTAAYKNYQFSNKAETVYINVARKIVGRKPYETETLKTI